MKTQQIAYCLVRKGSRKYNDKFSPVVKNAQMSVYWNKKVAQKYADEYGADVIRVVVLPEDQIAYL